MRWKSGLERWETSGKVRANDFCQDSLVGVLDIGKCIAGLRIALQVGAMGMCQYTFAYKSIKQLLACGPGLRSQSLRIAYANTSVFRNKIQAAPFLVAEQSRQRRPHDTSNVGVDPSLSLLDFISEYDSDMGAYNWSRSKFRDGQTHFAHGCLHSPRALTSHFDEIQVSQRVHKIGISWNT